MGIVNLAQLYGTPTYSKNAPNATDMSGSLSNINDGNTGTYFGISDNSPGTGTISFTISFPSPYTVNEIRIYLPSTAIPGGYIYVSSYYNNGGPNIPLITNARLVYNGLYSKVFTINDYCSSITVSFSFSLNYTFGSSIKIGMYDIQAYGLDIPTTRTCAYKDGIIYTFGKDVDAVSPLYIGGERIAIGATNHAMATPFRFYWDGDTYAILKAQGT